MSSNAGFKARNKIYEGQDIIFHRAIREADGALVILKLLKGRYADEDKLSAFSSEIECVRSLSHDGIVELLDIARDCHEPMLVLEDFGGEVLRNILDNNKLAVELFFKIAIKLTDTVAHIHNANMIHRNIRPDNVFFNIEKDIVKLTGIRVDTDTSKDNQQRHGWMSNNYNNAYISPEQTGRVNQETDNRTDLYSLGIVFYEMLTGNRPFASENHAEIIYSHLASEAVPVSQRNTEVPEVLSDIIGKLMEKKVENRFQTAAGLKRDLEECLKRLEFRNSRYEIKPFIFGKFDAPRELYLPKKVLGREAEVNRLLEKFETVRNRGIPRLVLVSGYSGIGKTTLVNELYSPIINAGGLFIQGKYDQYKNNTPYSSLIQSFDAFFNDILVQGKDSVSQWKNKFTRVLGANASIMTNIFPKLEIIIGTQKEAEKLPLTEAQNRFHGTVINFFQVAATKERPLVIFLDDLQWADSSSIKLMEFVLSDKENVYILFVGAYRNNEVDLNHPLQNCIDKLRRTENSMPEIINLGPLELDQVRELISELLHYSSEQTDLFARLCYEKSKGNPLFIQQFIKALKDEGVIWYSESEKKWIINLEQIPEHGLNRNIADLIAKKLEKLSVSAIQILKIASCINNIFEAETLSKITGISYGSVVAVLKEAYQEGIIIPWPVELYMKDENGPPKKYRFFHDRVQQAVNSLADEEQKVDFHYRIGKHLLEINPISEEGESLFEITEHLNLAQDIIGAKNEKLLLTRLNLESGKKAKSYSAYDRAMDYFNKGIEILGEQGWSSQYELTLELYTEATNTAYIGGQYQLMDQLGNIVLDRSKALLDKSKIYEIKIECLTVQNKLEEAVETARQVLKLFDITIPQKPTRLDIMAKYLKIRLALIGRTFEQIKNMPEMKGEELLIIMRILISAGIAAYTFSGPVYVIITLNVVGLSLKHGIAPSTPVAYAAYGQFLCAYLKKRELGYQFGKLAIEMQSNIKSKVYECKTNLLFEIAVRHHKEHIGNTLKGFPNNHRKGLNSGDLTSAGHIIMQHFVYMYLAGRELSAVRKEMEEYREELMRTGNKTAIAVCMIYLQGIVNLLDTVEEPWKLEGHYFNEEEELQKYIVVNDRSVIFNTYFNKMLIFFLREQYQEALKNLEAVKRYIDGAIGTFCIPVYSFYSALIHMELMSAAPGQKDKYVHEKEIKYYLSEIERFYRDAPENNENKYFLIKAEQARLQGNYDRAMEYYHKSIQAAGRHGFLQEEGLANELVARLLYSRGEADMAESYLKAAVDCYSKWGCLLKVKQLQELYKDLNLGFTKGMREVAINVDYSSPQQLDIETIVRASQAISEEIVLSELFKKMICIVLQNAGARKVLFIMETDGELFIEAEGNAEDREVKINRGEAVKGNRWVLEKLVNYVVNAREGIILNSEAEIEAFTGEKPSGSKGARSVFCMPVESKRNLVGILYLENDLMDGAFTGKHMVVLQVLASQLAISMENARLYNSMEQMVEERTEELKNINYELECANVRLENANRIKDQFLANMSHEMRTPLHGVIGLASMLKKGHLRTEQKETVNLIIGSAQSLMEIINEILDFSKIEANRIELEEQDFDLKQLINELLPSFTFRSEEKGIQLTCTVRQETVNFLRGDSLRIKQIMTNLLSNAIKFTEKGKVELEVSVTKGGGKTAVMVISVEDSGIGIPADKLEYIFQDFVQADNSITRKFGGTGLGLSITKKLVEMMNGTISAESTPGKGSIFRCQIYLGLSEGNKESNPTRARADMPASRGGLSGLKILVAEDNAISQKYIKSLLEYFGCHVTVVSDGLGVLENLQYKAFDCILMDKNMSELDGVETTGVIRRNETGTGKHIPIVALTASAIVGDREKLLAAGMDYYLSKPVNELELVQTLKIIKDGLVFETLPENTDGNIKNKLINRRVFLEEAALFGEEVMLEIIMEFLKDHRDLLQKIEVYISKADFISTEKEVHKLASTVSIFHCNSVVNLLKKMEQAAVSKDYDSLISTSPVLKKRIGKFVNELEDVRIQLLNKQEI